MTDQKSTQIESKGFLKRLADGDFGLAKTYWIYGVLIGIVFNIIVMLATSLLLLIILSIIHFIYILFAFRGIWNAANRYTGNITWAILAKTTVVLGIINYVYALFTLIEVLV